MDKKERKLAPENNLKKYREALYLTQYELGMKLGITSQAIGNIETRRADPRMRTKRILAEFFKVDVKELFPGEAKKQEANFSIAAA
jgi:putative transcriptional regulator